MTLTLKNPHTGISTGIIPALTFGRSAPLWLGGPSCAYCNFTTEFPEEQQVSRLHPWLCQPLLVDAPCPNEKVLDETRMVAIRSSL